MDRSIMGPLEESRCVALADFYLGQVAPNQPVTKPLNLTSYDDLYQFLLLDTQVGQEPETSRLAEAIACLQQYIGEIYGGLEPGHTTDFLEEELVAWHQRYCNISDWAGYQMLLDYPENWINPTLRLKKSDSFKELENNLGQASLSDENVQLALFDHLKKFEDICNLDVTAGYIDSVNGTSTEKGKTFKNADYYFLGQQRVEPFNYFWRKAYVELNAESTYLNPAAWTEWRPVTVPSTENILAMRPVFFAGRLMVVQVEGTEIPPQEFEFNGGTITKPGYWTLDIKLSYLGLDGIWSTPTSLSKSSILCGFVQTPLLAVVNRVGSEVIDDQLHIGFVNGDTATEGLLFSVAINALFEKVTEDKPALIEMMNGPFKSANILQYNFTNENPITPGSPALDKKPSGAQFLDLSGSAVAGVKHVRLNSLFGPILVATAAVSIDDLLSLVTQNTPEPQPDGTFKPIDFNSAHGTFYWELFFHLPFLIAHRLCEERKYHESQRWYQYIFNPHIRNARAGEKDPSERYWLCRPLLEAGDISYEAKGLVDPDAIAFSNRIHYRKAIFMGYVRCITDHADSLYRRLTRDSLVAAKLQYMRALSLMGPAPSAKAMSHWQPQSASAILDPELKTSGSSLTNFARSLDVDVGNLPTRVEGTPDFEILDLEGVLRPFTNDQLLDTWKYIEECLWNMRHNLTIDGKPMMLALYAPPTNPLDLLRAQAGGASGATRNAGGWKNIPHYRFRTLLSTAQNAVQILIGFGREVRQLMEMRDRGQLEELQQSHVIALGVHAKTIQEETIKQQEASLKGLENSKDMIKERAEHYKSLLDDGGMLGLEVAGDAASLAGKLLGAAAAVPAMVASSARTAPNIAGMAVGGMDFGGPPDAVSIMLGVGGAVLYAGGEAAQRTAFFLRRREEWTFAERQANSELLVIQEQLTAQQHSLAAARASLAHTQKANDQAQEIYSFYKTRATNVELYRWLLSQMATLYFQAYDAVVGLCLSAEASFQYEMGDYDTQVVRPNVWMDHRHGLSAGESMQLDMLRLERMYLERNERWLELTKTISLRKLFDKGIFISHKSWEDVINDLSAGQLDFGFSQKLFDSDYPGHYCRQITSITLSLPGVLGPYQDVRAILTQTGSTTVLKADVDSLDYLYGDGNQMQMPPPGVLLNPRINQQVGISHGLDDCGLFQLMFGDERYLPFEKTGAVSRWRLKFPRSETEEQNQLIASLTDIWVQVRYQAKVGGSAYTEAVLDRLPK